MGVDCITFMMESIGNSVCNFEKNTSNVYTGLTHECGVFGAIGNENWPVNSEIAQIIGIGLEALQHRYVNTGKPKKFFEMINKKISEGRSLQVL